MTFNSERVKKSAEAKIAAVRKGSKGRSQVTSARPDARPYRGDVRDSFSEMKIELWNFWKQTCTRAGFEYLIVSENVWSKNIFILQRVSGKGAETKLYFEFTYPTNLDSWLVLHRFSF